MGMQTRAAIAPGNGAHLIIDQIEVRSPLAGEVLVAMKASGLCHTDLSAMEGKFPVRLPAVLGHEGAGVVVECGPGVTTVAPGDRVILNNTAHCGVCAPCRSGKTGYCDTMALDTRAASPFTWRGQPLSRMGPASSFAAHTIIEAGRLTRFDPSISFEAAALVPCGVMTGHGAVRHVAKVEPGSKVLVFGMGSIGLNVLQSCRLADAAVIVALDTNPAKEDVAREFGATHFVDPAAPGEPLEKRIRALLGSWADYAFDCVGHPAVVRQGVGMVNPYWGVMVAVGIAPVGDQLSLPASTFYFGRSLRGTFIGDCNPLTETPQILDWYRQGKLAIDPLITHRIGLDEINTGFDLMKSGEAIRTVVMF
ncbi:MAG: alcohol dehydrogenase catalytic domain-containing protein [Sphingomonas sp.]